MIPASFLSILTNFLSTEGNSLGLLSDLDEVLTNPNNLILHTVVLTDDLATLQMFSIDPLGFWNMKH